jgi:hypothetical protein
MRSSEADRPYIERKLAEAGYDVKKIRGWHGGLN